MSGMSSHRVTEYEVEHCSVEPHCLWLLWDKVERGTTEAAFTRGEHRCGEPLDENCKKPTRTRDDIFSLLILNFLSYGLCIADVGSIDCLHRILRSNLLRIYAKEQLKVVESTRWTMQGSTRWRMKRST